MEKFNTEQPVSMIKLLLTCVGILHLYQKIFSINV